MPSYSKAPRGLSVLLWVTGICTGVSISPSPPLRQCPSRYTIHAGRNLPDKELRYLRTVIVTAAVHRGFSSRLAPLPLTFQQWAGFSPYTSSFELAGTCVFDKQSPGPFLCGLKLQPRIPGHPIPGPLRLKPHRPGIFRTGDPLGCLKAPLLPKLRGQFAEFLNGGSLARLRILSQPTCVGLRYGLSPSSLEVFLGR